MLTIGLRFDRSEAPRLKELATRVRAADLSGQRLELFDKAADSAEKGEPLIVGCSSPEEVLVMADYFVILGIARPAVEELSPSAD